MRPILQRKTSSGYALLTVLSLTGVAMIVLAATMTRTSNVAKLNERNNNYIINMNAAEAAVEKVYGLMAYDFQANGPGLVNDRVNFYRQQVPTASESSYWGNFVFSDGNGVNNQTYVGLINGSYTGPLPSQYEGLMAVGSPIYRIISNAGSAAGGGSAATGAIQEDILLALVPITTYAIFYNGLLEFSTCATMTVNGRVHANTNIYVGAGGSAHLTFNGSVTASGTVTAPYNNGSSWTGPNTYNSTKWRTTFNAGFSEHVPSVTLSLNMTNTRSMIEMPAPGVSPTNHTERGRLYNQAQIVLLVSNDVVTTTIQSPPSASEVAGLDPSPITRTNSFASAQTNLPFLSVDQQFRDQRENKTNIVTQIDIGKYKDWLATNPDVQSKFSGSGPYPTILYVADIRTVANSKQMTSVRLTNGTALPPNGGRGFSVATPNPLYVWGNYNATNHLHSTNTSATVPAALMSDALTILSSAWRDSNSYAENNRGPDASSATTVNAAILTGIVPSTSTSTSGFSGGVHNLPRLLEDWSGCSLWLNTSIISLYSSAKATNKFITPGSNSYYVPPTRRFSFDPNFLDPNKQPPGVPCALVPIRFNWGVPPPNTVSYNVTP